MKKIIAMILALVMVLAMTACGAAESAATDGTAAQTNAAAETYTVGICQIQTHPALDAATEGFKAALVEALGEGAVEFKDKDAGGEYANCATIVDGFVAENVDLILANATAPLQAAASATADIPILGTSITDYATALNIENWTGTVGKNISGTSDLAPLDEQAAMVQELFPDAKNVGLLYCSAEANSAYQVGVVEGYLTEMGFAVKGFPFADANELASVTQAACDESDVIYIPTDNTAAAYTETIANVVIPAKVPVVAGEGGICSGCGVVTLSIDYYDLGVATGKMAAKVLTGEANISEMPVEYAPQVTKMYNAANCEALGDPPRHVRREPARRRHRDL